jgi:hypothetical protein
LFLIVDFLNWLKSLKGLKRKNSYVAYFFRRIPNSRYTKFYLIRLRVQRVNCFSWIELVVLIVDFLILLKSLKGLKTKNSYVAYVFRRVPNRRYTKFGLNRLSGQIVNLEYTDRHTFAFFIYIVTYYASVVT